MPPGSILLVVMLAAMWFIVLNSWQLRNWRAVGLACVGTVAILLAGFLPWPVAPWIQAGVWGALLLVFLTRTELVAVMPPEEYRFVAAYIATLRRLGRLKERALEMDPTDNVTEFESALRSLERLSAPGDWGDLQADTVRELERRLAMMRLLHAKPSSGTLGVAEAQWLEVMQRFRRRLREKAAFWRGWPHMTRPES